MLDNILTFVYCLKNNYLVLKHLELLGQMHHTEWKAVQQQGSRGNTAFLSRQGLVLLPHHTASGHLGLWLRRREYYSKSAFEMTSRYKEIKQNFTISLDTQVAPLQGVVSVQESTLAHTFLYTHRRKYFPQLRLMFVKQNDVLCYSMISRSEEKSLYTNRSSVLFWSLAFASSGYRSPQVLSASSKAGVHLLWSPYIKNMRTWDF